MRRQIQQAAAAMKTMQCDFVQTKHLKLLNDQMVSHGRMHYRQADQLRWEYTSPYTYTFILNKDKVLLKNERRSDVIDVAQNRVFREIARLMMNSIVGNSLADDKNFTTTIAAGNNEWVATLVSKKKDLKQMFQRIVLHIERQKKCVTTVELYEKNGDHTVILLKNIRINEPVSAQLFKVD
jgi:outer membrane lipoprotein carrier protein